MEAIDKSEQLAIDACNEGAMLFKQGKLSKSQSGRVALYAIGYALEAEKRAVELLDPAWAAVSLAWRKAATEWLEIGRGLL